MSNFSRTDIELKALQVVVAAMAKRLEGDLDFLQDAMHLTSQAQDDLDTRSQREELNTAVQVLIRG